MKPYICVHSSFINLGVDEQYSPDFLDLKEDDALLATSDVTLVGNVLCADGHMVFQGDIGVTFSLVCALCNERFCYTISCPDWMHTDPISVVREGKWDLSEPIREELLLQVPFYPRCGGDECLRRKEIDVYMHSGAKPFARVEEYMK